jgi:peptidylprolyl isomerase
MKPAFPTYILAIAVLPLAAQTPTSPKPPLPHTATAASGTHTPASRAGACVRLPEISPKVPALPAGSPCAKHLYTITVTPPVKLENVSPLEGPALRDILKIEEPSSFSLDYVDIKVGTGELAGPHKFYSLHYTGYLTNGTKFDSSHDHPGQAPLVVEIDRPRVIPGWYTGFGGMRVGGKRRLFIPYQLAYGAKGSPPDIPEKSELIFDVELVNVTDTDPTPKPPPAAPAATPAPASPTAPGTPPAPATPPRP